MERKILRQEEGKGEWDFHEGEEEAREGKKMNLALKGPNHDLKIRF
jgi:hypothetical protein